MRRRPTITGRGGSKASRASAGPRTPDGFASTPPQRRAAGAGRIALASTLLLAACAGAQGGKDAPFPAGSTFAWLGTDAGGARRNSPADPSRYTITFDASGRATLRLDCNRGTAEWKQSGGALTLSPAAATKMMCPRGSLDVAYAADLAQVAQWSLDGRDLVLSGRDGSTMRFRPVGP